MQEIVCKKCGYVWKYAGDKHRISCSKCKTSITLPAAARTRVRVIDGHSKVVHKPKSTLTYHIPNSVLNDIKFSRALSWARTNGEPLYLKSDDEYRLSL